MFGVIFTNRDRARFLRQDIKSVRDFAENCSPQMASSLRSVADAADNERRRLDEKAREEG